MSIRAKIKRIVLLAFLRKRVMTETEIVLVVRAALGDDTGMTDILSTLREMQDAAQLASERDEDMERTYWTMTTEGALKAKQL